LKIGLVLAGAFVALSIGLAQGGGATAKTQMKSSTKMTQKSTMSKTTMKTHAGMKMSRRGMSRGTMGHAEGNGRMHMAMRHGMRKRVGAKHHRRHRHMRTRPMGERGS
jgi:hypothetical protein